MVHEISENVEAILLEISQVLRTSDYSQTDAVLAEILSANRIVCFGAGRVGLTTDAFAKRLVHLGFKSHSYSDVTLPRLGSGDLMIIASGSGNTESIVGVSKIAKRHGLRLLLISSNTNSQIAKLADVTLTLNCPNKTLNESGIQTIQPMTTLFEQSASLFFDAIVLTLMSRLEISNKEMMERHNVIE